MQTARIVQTSSELQFYMPGYDPSLTNALKGYIPANERRPVYINNKFSHWVFTPNHLDTVKRLCVTYLGSEPSIQGGLINSQPLKPQTRLLNVRYIGTPKDRGNGEKSAFGHDGQDWSIVFPELVLKQWFEGENATADTTDLTLYGVLNLKRDCAGNEVRKAWARMAKRYHPDVNKDDDAAQMMQRINEAYEVLNNPMKRKKYDGALTMIAASKNNLQDRANAFSNIWRPPERCGFILATGMNQLGRFVIETIHQWEPIKNSFGQELVTSWPMGSDKYVENWV